MAPHLLERVVCVRVWVCKCRKKRKSRKKEREEQISIATWKVRIDNCCEGQAQEERKEERRREARE
jgi:hypothetical protein